MNRLSLNQKTVNSVGIEQAVKLTLEAGLEAIGVWREPLAEYGLENTKRLLVDSGLRVSSLCRGGFITEPAGGLREKAISENIAAIKEAAAIGARCLVMVVGGLPIGSKDINAARQNVFDGIRQLAPIAGDLGVQLALEPMHPIFTADRGVLATLEEALDIAEQFPQEQVGVVIDTFHLWWDPAVERMIERSAGRISSFQICDWITPFPGDALLSRGMMGDGHIDFRHFRKMVEDAGYDGDIEVEIFNADIWKEEPREVIKRMKNAYKEFVLD